MPQLTIITINYNNAAGLGKTMKSVLAQTSRDFEYIVVDGANHKTTTQHYKGKVESDHEVIAKFISIQQNIENGFTPCFWLSTFGEVSGGFYSEPDSGIYNAMNKGILKAKGNYIHFLNSGDWLVNEFVVEKMLKELIEYNHIKNEIDIFIGKRISVRQDGKIKIENNSPYLGFITFYGSTLQHTSAYIRRSLFNQYGIYDESLKIVADWKWYLIVAGLNKANVIFTEINVSYFDTCGISSTNLQLDCSERRKVLEELVPAPILSDYKKYYLDIVRIERLKKYRILFCIFWFIERILFKFEKWSIKLFEWKST